MKTVDAEFINKFLEIYRNKSIDDEYLFRQDPIMVVTDIGVVPNFEGAYSQADMLEQLYDNFVDKTLVTQDKFYELVSDCIIIS